MSEPKPLASLSSGLLARKGQAKPAMRPQAYGSFGFGPQAISQDDLGWNDMGLDPASAVPQPITPDTHPIIPETPPAVVLQQEELARELQPVIVEVAPRPVIISLPEESVRPRAAAGSKGKAAFTLRLDPDRHLRLRLTCAVLHKSAQAVVIAALDAFLDQQPSVAELARTTTARKTK